MPDIIAENIIKPVLIRLEDETLQIAINFDPQLEAILKEVKYLKILGKEGIPQEALDFYDRNEELTGYILNLTRTVEW